MIRFGYLLMVMAIMVGTPVAAQTSDPLRSVMWETVRDAALGAGAVIFDDLHVRVYAPATIEDPMNVPVSIRVTGIDDIEEIVVLADHNPIAKVLSFRPMEAEPYLAFRIKVQEATPVRAAVRSSDGTWRVGGIWVDAPGGGCTTPSVAQASRLWEEKLNTVQASIWDRADGGQRLRMRLIHPMDTGLVDSIPAFYLESLTLRSPGGRVLAELRTFEPLSENPTLTFAVPPRAVSESGYRVTGRDTDGNEVDARITARSGPLNFSPHIAVGEAER